MGPSTPAVLHSCRPIVDELSLLEGLDFRMPGILKGSWDLVTRVIIKVTILINTYNPN